MSRYKLIRPQSDNPFLVNPLIVAVVPVAHNIGDNPASEVRRIDNA